MIFVRSLIVTMLCTSFLTPLIAAYKKKDAPCKKIIFSDRSQSGVIGNEREENTSKILEADAQFALLQKRAEILLKLRMKASIDSSEIKKEEEYQEQVHALLKTFVQLRKEGANLACFDSADGYAFYSIAYAEMTETFIRFFETNIFPNKWEELLRQD